MLGHHRSLRSSLMVLTEMRESPDNIGFATNRRFTALVLAGAEERGRDLLAVENGGNIGKSALFYRIIRVVGWGQRRWGRLTTPLARV